MNLLQIHSRKVAWTIWFIASVFYAYQYILRVMPNIMLEDIMSQFGIGAATFGQFSGIYYIGYSLMHLPIGMLLDRFGPRKIMTACILLSVLGVMPLIFSDFWIYPILGRFFIGVGSSAAILGIFKIIRMTFPEGRFSRMLSFSVTIGLMGAIYGGGPVSYMRQVFSYQTVVQLIALGGIFLAIATYFIVPEVKSPSKGTVRSSLKEVFTNKKVLFSCLCAGLMVGPLEGFADVWGTSFLKQAYGLEGTVAASMPSLIFIGMCIGAPFLSLIAEKTGSLLGTIVGTGIVMMTGFVFLLAFHLPPVILSLSFLVIGMACAYQVLAIYKASTYVSEKVAGLTTAVANMIIMLFGYAFHGAIGTLINVVGGPESSLAFIYGVAVIPASLCLGTGGFLLLLLREKKLKRSLQSMSSSSMNTV